MLAMPPFAPVELYFLITGVFLIAGFVKGVIGLGLPTVSLALLAATIGLKPAMAILVLPALLTNVWQGLYGNALKEIILRLWTFLGAAFLFTWIGAGILADVASPILSALLGTLLVSYALFSLNTPQISIPPRWEALAAPVIGSLSGIFTGLTGSFVVPGVLYLQALNLPRAKFMQAMGVTFTMATISLGVSLGGHGLMSKSFLYLSVFALAPTFSGMLIGIATRKRLNDTLFRKIFFIALLTMGVYIVGRTLLTGYL